MKSVLWSLILILLVALCSGDTKNDKNKMKVYQVQLTGSNSAPIKIQILKQQRRKNIIKCCGFKKCLPSTTTNGTKLKTTTNGKAKASISSSSSGGLGGISSFRTTTATAGSGGLADGLNNQNHKPTVDVSGGEKTQGSGSSNDVTDSGNNADNGGNLGSVDSNSPAGGGIGGAGGSNNIASGDATADQGNGQVGGDSSTPSSDASLNPADSSQNNGAGGAVTDAFGNIASSSDTSATAFPPDSINNAAKVTGTSGIIGDPSASGAISNFFSSTSKLSVLGSIPPGSTTPADPQLRTSATPVSLKPATTPGTTTTTTTTTSTTTPPPCRLTCTDFNKYLQENPTVAPSSADGSMQNATKCNNRPYYVSKVSVTRNEAALRCKAMRMTLLAVTSFEEMECLGSLKDGTFWTSGSNEDPKCDEEKKYAWCSTGFNISDGLISSDKFWLPPTVAPPTLERCLAVVLSATPQKGMVHKKCDDALPFICQHPVDCPKDCFKDVCGEKITALKLNKTSYGFWINIGSYTYLLGNKPMNFLENYRQCCALGMETLNLDSAAEQLGLTNMSLVFKNDWKANFNYWTSGTWRGSPAGHFSFCEPFGPAVFPPNLTWQRGQPDNKGGNESCVHFRFVLNSTGTIMTDRSCDYKYIFACKGNWTTATRQCCSIGMNLASIESAGKLGCFSKIVEKFGTESYGDFWLSGTDLGCPSDFWWCSLNRGIINSELKWKTGHPKSGLDCIYLESRNGSVLLASADCTEEKKYLCEARKKATVQKGTQGECAEIWNITPQEIDLLMNATLLLSPTTTISLDLKCFLKCMGVEFGMFDLGMLSNIATLRQIELVTMDDPVKMEQGFTAFDACSGKKFDDECVTAYETYKCGQEKAPDLVTKIVKNNFDNGTEYSPPTPCVPPRRTCWLTDSIPCQANQTIIDTLFTNKKDDYGYLATYKGDLNLYIAFMDYSRRVNPVNAYKSCCARGMRLLEPETRGEMENIIKAASLEPWNDQRVTIGDTRQINQTHEVWCRSGQMLSYDIYYTASMIFPCWQSVVSLWARMWYIVPVYEENKNIYENYLNGTINEPTFFSFICIKP
ncbi:uncharacterized protein LOC135943178 [Cloeon dipterum]|uniref:uncharacterized protein LOC135943178 n=1 Tax=Cloeon dipterum TaxID=197152 RepID=UPI00322077A6